MMTESTAVRKLFSPAELFVVFCRAFRALPGLRAARGSGALTAAFSERLMLAVTQVNGCALCSYAHTKMALEAGLSGGEIAALLAGEGADIPEAELPAVLFAQHYADSRGKPARETWERIRALYGERQAAAILCAVQVIMLGNALGIPLGSLGARIRRQPEGIDARSSLGYELLVLVLAVLYLPLGLLAACAAALLRRPRL